MVRYPIVWQIKAQSAFLSCMSRIGGASLLLVVIRDRFLHCVALHPLGITVTDTAKVGSSHWEDKRLRSFLRCYILNEVCLDHSNSQVSSEIVLWNKQAQMTGCGR